MKEIALDKVEEIIKRMIAEEEEQADRDIATIGDDEKHVAFRNAMRNQYKYALLDVMYEINDYARRNA